MGRVKQDSTRPVPSKQWSASELCDGHEKLMAVKKESLTPEELKKQIAETCHHNTLGNFIFHIMPTYSHMYSHGCAKGSPRSHTRVPHICLRNMRLNWSRWRKACWTRLPACLVHTILWSGGCNPFASKWTWSNIICHIVLFLLWWCASQGGRDPTGAFANLPNVFCLQSNVATLGAAYGCVVSLSGPNI